MKISQMLLREDFYAINYMTLTQYFNESNGVKKIYVYPQLNAIVTARPAKEVKKYLLSEYSIKGNPIKAFIVKCYVKICLCTGGILAAKKIKIRCNLTDDMLIYPCNKKYRIFDFAAGKVDVISKSGFPKNDLLKEIEFRENNKEKFIPEIIESNDSGYSEKIIDGIPLARISHGFDDYRKLAIDTLEKYSAEQGFNKSVSIKEYVGGMLNLIKEFTENIRKDIDYGLLIDVTRRFADLIVEDRKINLMLSHGDLQSGNIWIENSGKMYIIDWESWGIRSEWYDRAVLYENLRGGDVDKYFLNCDNLDKSVVVCLEDIIFKLNELNNLPENYGEKDFNFYLKKVATVQKG